MLPRLLLLVCLVWRVSPGNSAEAQTGGRHEKGWLTSVWEFFFPKSLIDSFEREPGGENPDNVEADKDNVEDHDTITISDITNLTDNASVYNENSTLSSSNSDPQAHNITQTRVKHTCVPYEGCTPQLNCTDYTRINDSKLDGIIKQGKVVAVNLTQLQYLLENVTYANSCVLVMFYMVWCQHSIDFVPVYNKLGVVFPQMPVVAMDFGLFSPDRYLLAYVPRVILYYSGRVVYDIDTTMIVENLTDILANMTGFNPGPIPTDSEMLDCESPLPTEVEENNTILWLSVVVVVIILTVNFIQKSEACASCRERTARVFHLKED